MRFRNPCNTCLVRAACDVECITYKKFKRKYRTPSAIIQMLILFFYMSITIPSLTVVIETFDSPYNIIVLISTLIGIIITGVTMAIKIEDKMGYYGYSIPQKRQRKELKGALKYEI